MNAPARLAALACAALALAACDPVEVDRHSTEATRYFAENVLGTDHDVHLVPATVDGPGALVVTRSRLIFADGSRIPLYQVDTGLYRTPTLRTRHGAQGSRICAGRPVNFLSLHRGAGGLYFLNAGDWPTAPARPAGDAQAIPGACQTAAYTLGSPPA